MSVSSNTRAQKKENKDGVLAQPDDGEEGKDPPTVEEGLQEQPDGVVNPYPVDEDAQDDKDGRDFGEFGRGLKLKFPEFWGDQPETWFQQVEAVFWRYGVRTEERRYYLVVCHLPQ